MTLLGRILCKMGFHHWKFEDVTEKHGDVYHFTTYAWCSRGDTPAYRVNIERIRVPKGVLINGSR